MPTLLLRLLGSFQVQRDGQNLHGFATDKARALLAFLVVERERPHRRESLSALLWPEQSDERARQSLRQALSHLRQALGGEDFLLVSPQDIQIHPQASVWTDVSEVEALTRACGRHHHRSIEGCLPCLRRQESLLEHYSGDFLAGFPSQNSDSFEEWLTLTRERLHQQAVNAHVALANLAERRDDLPVALYHVREQIRLEPWREEAHRQAMRLYFQKGERSKALAQFQTCQHILSNELAVSPTSETIRLYKAIQNQTDPEPKFIVQPPEAFTSFVGRVREQDEIAERLADPDCRLITILGMGGIGKSRLALQVARSHAGLYRDGIFLVPLVATDDILAAIAIALGYTTPDAASRLPDLLREKEILLLLDNFEHLVGTGDVLSELLAVAPGLQIIVTSRERLRLREEWVYILEGLSFPTGIDEVDSRRWDSLALFKSRAVQIDSRFTLTNACCADVADICRLVEGHPLAIEVSASAIAEQSCSEIAKSLHKTFDALVPTLRNFPERHRSLRTVFEHSWKLLSQDEHTRLSKLSVFAGGFSAEAALQVAETTTQQLNGLASKSLVRLEPGYRYALHESVRQFAAEKLINAESVSARHGAYYADLASHCNGSVSISTLDMLQKELANLRTAWKWSLLENIDITAKLLTGLALLYSLRGPLSEGELLFSATIQSISDDSSKKELKTKIAIELARIYNSQTRHQEAIELVQAITGEPHLRARALLIWGQALDAQCECEAARPILEQALALAHELGDKRIEADSLRELGNAANRLSEYAVAVPLYMQSLAISHELDDKRGQSATLNNLGTVEWDSGELDAAQAHFLDALGLYRELGNLLGEAKAINNLSNVSADQGDLSASLHYCAQALRIHREMGNPRGQCAVFNNQGATYYSLGQYDEARTNYLQALALYRESNNQQAESETLANLSLLDCVQGNLTAGRENAQKAITLAEKTGDKINQANALYYLGCNHLAAGNYEAAEIALYQALALRHEIPHPGRIAEIQAELALSAHQCSKKSLALERLAPVLELLPDPSTLDGTDDPYRTYQIAAHILAANGNRKAELLLKIVNTLIELRAAKISDPLLQQSFRETHKKVAYPITQRP